MTLYQCCIKEYIRISRKEGLAKNLREARDSRWRDVAKHDTLKKRRMDGGIQVRSGRRVDHDKMLIDVLGLHWQHSTTMLSFTRRPKETLQILITRCLEHVDLPLPFFADPARKKVRFSESSEPVDLSVVSQDFSQPLELLKLPRSLRMKADPLWEGGTKQMECVVDNNVLAEILNGRAALGTTTKSKHARATPIVVQCACLIAQIFERGWVPRYHVLDFVRWRRRCWNTTSDILGRCALAQGKPLDSKHSCFLDLVRSAQWIQIHTDGGVDHSGASASVTTTVWKQGPTKCERTLVRAKAMVLEPGATPFFAEACALLEALRDLPSNLLNVFLFAHHVFLG